MKKTGYIALIDVLGAREFNIDWAVDFIEKRDEIIKKANQHYNKMISSMSLNFKLPTPEIATFGDSIVFAWDVGYDLKYKALHLTTFWLSPLIRLGLANDLMFRGAMAFGDYIFDNKTNTILGPAISDVASWYEEANWLGIIATPQCCFLIKAFNEDIIKKLGAVDTNQWFIEYPVPLKAGKVTTLFALNWPKQLFENAKDITAKGALSISFERNIPKGTEDKYFNSMSFLEFCAKSQKTEIHY